MKNREVFYKDPSEIELLNNGVAKVNDGTTEQERRLLRYELATFVCKGQYEKGLRTILSSYLSDLGRPEQRGVWVSGFYGSGKSHFVKMLRALWTDTEFASPGDTARTLAHLPEDICTLLTELSTEGRRAGGLHAAAGTLGSGAGSVRLALLGIVFRSVGLPEQYDRAQFVMWLRDQGLIERVDAHLAAQGLSLQDLLPNFIMSVPLHEAIVAHLPSLKSETKLRDLLKAQFPTRPEISDADMLESLRRALTRAGRMPCTLIALDEVQQFIGNSPERVNQVQEVTESCCKTFGSKLLFVGTGQSAMGDQTLQISKLSARFKTKIELSDNDVDTVVREVLLRKKPSAEAALRTQLTRHAGEISRHLAATRIEASAADEADLVTDYPILPVRRRFWERSIRALDAGGVNAQLRNQLTAVYNAVRDTADCEVGHVVGGDFLFFDMAEDLLRAGVLTRGVREQVVKLQGGSDDDKLKARLLGLAFLIGKLPREPVAADTGIRATPDTFADLLVEDLNAGSGELRKRIPALLAAMVDAGMLMQVDEEFRVQTPESAAWNQEYRTNLSSWQSGADKLSSARGELLQDGVRAALRTVSVQQGASKEKREVVLHFGMDVPKPPVGSIPVWVRDGWTEPEKAATHDAVALGDLSPVVVVWLPMRAANDLDAALASLKAAEETLARRGNPNGTAGIEARSAIETRKLNAANKLAQIVAEVIDNARVLQAGGQEVLGTTLADRVKSAATASVARLFPEFSKADNPKWATVLSQAKLGQTQAMELVGHIGDPDKHPVAVEILRFAAAGKKGSEIRSHFDAPPYGWPKDAVDGALYVLVLTEHLRASANGQSLTVSALDRPKIGTAEFRAETVPVTAGERLAVRKLMAEAGIQCKPGEEAATLPSYLRALGLLAEAAGGEAPRPARPSTATLDDLGRYSGNELVKKTWDAREALSQHRTAWLDLKAQIEARLPGWTRLESLLPFANGLGVEVEVRVERAAILANCGLLATPDPVPALGDALATALRQALNAERARCEARWSAETDQLEAEDSWIRLTEGQRSALMEKHQIGVVEKLAVATDDRLLTSLRRRSLADWRNEHDALPSRFQAARLEAARLAEPKAERVSLKQATLKSDQDVEDWLSDARERIQRLLKSGPVIV